MAPENAGLDKELFSKRKRESALDVESATLSESAFRAVVSIRPDTVSEASAVMAVFFKESDTTSPSATFLRFLFLLTSCPNIVIPDSAASAVMRIILYVCFLNCNYFLNLQKTNILHILDLHRNFLAVLTALFVLSVGFAAYAQNPSAAIRLSTVVIDPGHGGKDAGCVSPSGKTLEKNIVLDIGKRLADMIRAGYPDVKVILTRSDDTFVTLQGRADIANRNNANLFISIHINSVEGKRSAPNGYSVHILGQYTSKNKDLYAGNMDVVRRENSVIKLEDDYTTRYEGFDPNDPESYIFMNLMQNAHLEQSFNFAQLVDKQMKGGAIQNSRGISQDPFYVLWRTAMPAVLVECGFMTNTADRSAFITEKGRERIAADLYSAFKSYKKEYDGTDAIPDPGRGVTTESEEASASAKGTETAEDKVGGIYFGTQVLVSSKSMSVKDPYFKGNDVVALSSGRMFKYIIGISSDLETARKKHKALKRDYNDSFLVMIEDGTARRVN